MQRSLPTLILGACVLVALTGSTAAADPRPSSGDPSILSGRTLGTGKSVLAAAVGWPGIWGEAHFAPSSRLNIGVRGQLSYGTPFMGFNTGVGGGVGLRGRYLVYSKGHMDVSVAVEPMFVIGQGALFGQGGPFADNLGFGNRTDGGVLFGFQVSDVVTLTAAPMATLSLVSVPDTKRGVRWLGGFGARGAVEATMSSDTLLFAQVAGGYGFGPSRLFDGSEMLELSLGVAYVM